MTITPVQLGTVTFGFCIFFGFPLHAFPTSRQGQGGVYTFLGQIGTSGNGRVCNTQLVSVEMRQELQRLDVQVRGPKPAVLDKEGKRLRELVTQQKILMDQLRQLKSDFVDDSDRDTDLDTTDDEVESEGDGLSPEERASVQNGEVLKKNILKMQKVIKQFQKISRKVEY
ncbi:MAG: hypothetical protein IJR99_12940 [Kiritimatiellae bacterium]|nr:hypothetical protein [Kiritimatiellia bacterium]